MDLNQYLLNPKYQSYWKTLSDAHPQEGEDGLVDSVRFLLKDYNDDTQKVLCRLLKAF